MANEEHLAKLKEGVEAWNQWRDRVQSLDLSGVKLQGAELSHANFHRVDLSRSDLQFADLRCANLRRADLSDVKLIMVNLMDADLQEANLSRAPSKRWSRSRFPLSPRTSIFSVTGKGDSDAQVNEGTDHSLNSVNEPSPRQSGFTGAKRDRVGIRMDTVESGAGLLQVRR